MKGHESTFGSLRFRDSGKFEFWLMDAGIRLTVLLRFIVGAVCKVWA